VIYAGIFAVAVIVAFMVVLGIVFALLVERLGLK
jgi:hypothetical protein